MQGSERFPVLKEVGLLEAGNKQGDQLANRLPAGEILFNTKEVGSSGFYGINCGS